MKESTNKHRIVETFSPSSDWNRGLVLAAGLGFVLMNGKTRVAPVGVPSLYDDFRFQITKVVLADRWNGRESSRGRFRSVEFVVDNQAGRVSHDLSRNFHPLLLDRSGTGFASEAIVAADDPSTPSGTPISPGESRRVSVVFDAPIDLEGARIQLRSGPIGDFLEWVFYGPSWFQL